MKQKSRKVKRAKKKWRIAIVVSQFNRNFCEALVLGAQKTLSEAGISLDEGDIYRVPGAFEIPLMAKKCGQKLKYDGIICLGVVIRGETPHFDYICQGVTSGVMQVMLDLNKPLGFGVLTVNTEEQARARSSDDEYNKGRETALAVLSMLEVLEK